MDRTWGLRLKQYFCTHHYIVKEARSDYGYRIPSIASLGLTEYFYDRSQSTDYYAAPYTIINTHYRVKNPHVYLYAKQCIYCGKVLACSAFEAQEKERNHDILKSEGL